MTTIYQKLQITHEDYESIVWSLYSNWCISVTNTNNEYQKVIANSSINNWFRMELTKCEIEFMERTAMYTNTNVTQKDFETCYKKCALTIFDIRPMALLNGIVKPTKKVKGISVNAPSQN